MSASRKIRPVVAGFVYLIELGGFHKIGHSRNPTRRLRAFAKLPLVARLIHQFPSLEPARVEKTLHYRFHSLRVRGEWFTLSDEDLALIRSVKRADTIADLPATLAAKGPPRQINLRFSTDYHVRLIRTASLLGLTLDHMLTNLILAGFPSYEEKAQRIVRAELAQSQSSPDA